MCPQMETRNNSKTVRGTPHYKEDIWMLGLGGMNVASISKHNIQSYNTVQSKTPET
jgi:hypothetical protein